VTAQGKDLCNVARTIERTKGEEIKRTSEMDMGLKCVRAKSPQKKKKVGKEFNESKMTVKSCVIVDSKICTFCKVIQQRRLNKQLKSVEVC